MITSHRILGWVEEITVCDCCGKSGLAGTFACETIESEVLHYGSTCARRNTGIKNPTTAAAVYLRERTDEARKLARQTAEYRAMRARYAERDALNMAAGREAADFVREASNTFRAVAERLAAQYRVPVTSLLVA